MGVHVAPTTGTFSFVHHNVYINQERKILEIAYRIFGLRRKGREIDAWGLSHDNRGLMGITHQDVGDPGLRTEFGTLTDGVKHCELGQLKGFCFTQAFF
jgi:hypothetical protein